MTKIDFTFRTATIASADPAAASVTWPTQIYFFHKQLLTKERVNTFWSSSLKRQISKQLCEVGGSLD